MKGPMATQIQKIIADGKAMAAKGRSDDEILLSIRPRLESAMRNRTNPPLILNGPLLDIIHGRR